MTAPHNPTPAATTPMLNRSKILIDADSLSFVLRHCSLHPRQLSLAVSAASQATRRVVSKPHITPFSKGDVSLRVLDGNAWKRYPAVDSRRRGSEGFYTEPLSAGSAPVTEIGEPLRLRVIREDSRGSTIMLE
jgi:hypothetical protein